MEKKVLEDSGSEIFQHQPLSWGVELPHGDYYSSVPVPLYRLDWRDHVFNDALSVQMEGKQTSTTASEDKDKPSLFMSRE